MSVGWAVKDILDPENLAKLHDPIGYSHAFGLKKPMVFCAHEDCAYKIFSDCPAGKLKKNCPNRSALDFKGGCVKYVGKPYQYDFLKESLSGEFRIITDVTGRGTGKSAIKATQKVLMESTTEPYVKAMLYKTPRPVPVKIIVTGNTQDTCTMLRNHIGAGFESSDEMYSFVKDFTRTYISTHSGAEIFFKTAGVDGKGLRGFHAEIIKNVKQEDVKCTIIFMFDEAWFARASHVIKEVMRPSLQVGNVFSQIVVTTTPHDDKGEVAALVKVKKPRYKHYNFASYHNKYTDLELLDEFRDHCEDSGQGSIYNREVLGQSESDEGLFMPLAVFMRGINDDLEVVEYDRITKLERMPGIYYCGVDPNKFRQLVHGDFAAYVLFWVASDRSKVRLVTLAKYKLDLANDFRGRLATINEVFAPRFLTDANSGYGMTLANMGLDVRNASNDRRIMNPAMRLWKDDIVSGTFEMPASDALEEERRCFIFKEDGVGSLPKLDHRGQWGQGYSNDLMRCIGYAYIGMMQDFNIGSMYEQYADSIDNNSGDVIPIDSLRKSSNKRLRKVTR